MIPYLLIDQHEQLESVFAGLENTDLVGLDLETTGLNPRQDQIRLMALAVETTDGGPFCYLIDVTKVDLQPVLQKLQAAKLIIHNAAFDLGFLAQHGFVPGDVTDTMILAQLLTAGTDQ